MRARDYNPATAEFTSVDPAVATTGQPYVYARDALTYRTDPTGRIETGFMLGAAPLPGEDKPALPSGLSLPEHRPAVQNHLLLSASHLR